MIQLTFLREGYSILLKDWKEALDKAFTYLDDKMIEFRNDKSYEEDWADIKYLRRVLPIFVEEDHDAVVGNTIRFDAVRLER